MPTPPFIPNYPFAQNNVHSQFNREELSGRVRTSFSGADCMVVAYKPKLITDIAGPEETQLVEFANLQTLSISTTRDIAALRPLGTAWADELSLGARTVAGTLIFTMFDGDSLRALDGVRPGRSHEDAGGYMADDMPPFNIVINETNEFGQAVTSVLLGIRIVNSGVTIGVQDIYTEQVYSYVATRWIPFRGAIDFTKSLKEIATQNPDLTQAIFDYYHFTDPLVVPPRLPSADKASRLAEAYKERIES